MLLSKATVVLFVITLKLGTDNPSHHFLTHPVNVPIIIWVLVLLCQFVPHVIKYNVIVYDHLFNIVLISFRQSISRYTPLFPNCSIFFLSWFIFRYFVLSFKCIWVFFFYFTRPYFMSYRVHIFVPFKFILCISIIISSISFSLI